MHNEDAHDNVDASEAVVECDPAVSARAQEALHAHVSAAAESHGQRV